MWRNYAKRAFSRNSTHKTFLFDHPKPRCMATASAASESPWDEDDRARRRERERLRRRQVKVETEAWEKASQEYSELVADMCERKLAPNLPYTKGLFLGWFEPLRAAIAKEQRLCLDGKMARKRYAPFFSELPPDMMAIITMHKLMGMLMTKDGLGAARVTQASLSVGDAIEQETKIRKLMSKKKKKTDEEIMLKKKIKILMRQQKVRQMQYILNKEEDSKWGHGIRAMVGSRLIELLIETAFIQPPPQQYHQSDSPPDIRPAFVHRLRRLSKGESGKQCGFIECDPMVLRGIERTVSHVVIPYMPMLVPPAKWTGYDKGGHFYLPSYIMRTHGARQQRAAVKNAPIEQMKPIFQALDTLGSTKWRINRRVLHVIERIWATGECIADLVDRNDVPLPEKPDTADETEIRSWKYQVRSARKENMERYALRCDVELKLEVARNMKDEAGFYYPHNLDFRGRAYPMHPYLNHLGSDFCRGILEFAEGRPLGKSGLRWLKIHLATLYGGGVDKLSHDGRLEFTENHLDDIFDSADRPLEGRRWWLNAEDPCQLLSVCISLTDALRSSSPEMHISHVHVHQDGSCNGLQHYAALGRDKVGGASVNLIADVKPADVYTGVAERVRERMRVDALKDPDEFPEALFAKTLLSQVDRKLVKQTVMTSVYGVTYIGAREQIRRRLKERGCFSDDSEMFSCACYGAKTTITALGELFEAARGIMGWLGDCAKIIVSQNEPVQWTTPLGLPVVQPYRILGTHSIKTSLQSLTVKRETEKVMARRHKSAFPPNFVHSLDSSHMMMTAVACRKAGITFAGVHDSYWTHAGDIDQMNRILRQKFVELYQAPILENLLESFEQSFPNLVFPPLPERGELNLRDVLESPYFFN